MRNVVFNYAKYSNVLCHYGRKGMKWGQNIYGDEDGLSEYGRTRLRGYDDDGDSDHFDYSESWYESERYVNKWQREYGSTPINRLRFEADYESGGDYVSPGKQWCDDCSLHSASWSKIYDAYDDYRSSRDWD